MALDILGNTQLSTTTLPQIKINFREKLAQKKQFDRHHRELDHEAAFEG